MANCTIQFIYYMWSKDSEELKAVDSSPAIKVDVFPGGYVDIPPKKYKSPGNCAGDGYVGTYNREVSTKSTEGLTSTGVTLTFKSTLDSNKTKNQDLSIVRTRDISTTESYPIQARNYWKYISSNDILGDTSKIIKSINFNSTDIKKNTPAWETSIRVSFNKGIITTDSYITCNINQRVDISTKPSDIKTTYGDIKYSYPNYTLQNPDSWSGWKQTGYYFGHWREYDSTQPSGMFGRLAGASITVKSNRTFYAVYEANEHTLTINPNGGKADWTSKAFSYNTPINLPQITKLGNSITTFNNSHVTNKNGTWVFDSLVDSNVTLTPTWTPAAYNINYVPYYNGKEYKFIEGSISQEYETFDKNIVLKTFEELTGYRVDKDKKLVLLESSGEGWKSHEKELSQGDNIQSKWPNSFSEDVTLGVQVTPTEYNVDYYPVYIQDDGSIQELENYFSHTKRSSLVTEYSVIDDEQVLDENQSFFLDSADLGRGFYFKYSKRSSSDGKLISPKIEGPYKDHDRLKFVSVYTKAKYKFVYHFYSGRYEEPEETIKESRVFEYGWHAEPGDDYEQIWTDSQGKSFDSPMIVEGYTFNGWYADDKKFITQTENGWEIQSENVMGKLFKWSDDLNNRFLAPEKSEEVDKIKEIHLYPKWTRNSGVRVKTQAGFVYPAVAPKPKASEDIDQDEKDSIRVYTEDGWKYVKSIWVYDGDWKPIQIKSPEIKPPNLVVPLEINEYEEI